ncbi:MAG: DNA glycosylase AlkZ-like family protein [Thermoplasmatota archaeon]
MKSYTRAEALRLAHERQLLAYPARSIGDALARLPGLPAAAPGLAFALAARVERFTLGDVEDGLGDGSIARVAAMRGDVHAFDARFARTAFTVTRGPRERAVKAFLEREGVPEAALDAERTLVAEATRDAPKSAEELRKILGRAVRPDVLAAIAARGELERAETKGGWRSNLHAWRAPREALAIAATDGAQARALYAELARRYFRAYGPASRADFADWAGYTDDEADFALLPLADALEEARGEWTDAPLFDLAERPPARGDPTARRPLALLPAGDAYVRGYGARFPRIDERAPVVVEGELVATWDLALGRRRVAVKWTPLPSVAMPAGLDRMLDAAVGRLAAIFDVPDIAIERVEAKT